MGKSNFKPLNLTDEVLSRMQANIQQAFSNVDQASPFSIKTVTAQYNASNADDVVLANSAGGPFTVILPNPSTITKQLTFRTVGASTNAVTLQPASPKVLIDGKTSLTLTSTPIRLVASDGTNYVIV